MWGLVSNLFARAFSWQSRISHAFFNHRAKQGGSLFQGGSGGEKDREATPQIAVGYPSVRRVLFPKVALNVDGFGRNLAEMIF